MDKLHIKSIIESILFISSEIITSEEIAQVVGVDVTEVEDIFIEMKEEYIKENRGIRIIKKDNGFIMTTNPQNSEYISKFLNINSAKVSLSNVAYEVLIIIALNQPITRQEIEKIRGVSSDSVLKNLLEKGLIKEAGRLDTIGKPVLYEVTDLFLSSIGVSSVDEIKKMFKDAQK